MKPILCAVLLAMMLHPAECRRYDQDEGDHAGPSGGRQGYRGQKGSQGGILDQLSGLGQKLGLPTQLLQGGLGDLAQKFGLSGGMDSGAGKKGLSQGGPRDKPSGKASQGGILDQLSGLGQKLGLPTQLLQGGLGDLAQKFGLSGGMDSGAGMKGLLQGGPRDKPSGKARKSGSSGGRKKFGSRGNGAESGRNGYRSNQGGDEEESGGPPRRGSRYGGNRRQNQDYEDD